MVIESGKKYGMLRAIEYLKMDKNKSIWKFKCKCGKIIEKRSDCVTGGGVRSCGNKQCGNIKIINNEIKLLCTKCQKFKWLKNFPNAPKNRRRLHKDSHCRSCKEIGRKKWKIKNADKYKQMCKIANVRLYAKRKSMVFETYGPICVCCKEIEMDFLTIDHIGGGGRKHRKLLKTSSGLYKDIIKQGFPKDKFRILCMNCNFATRDNKTCPHGKKGK